jgi:hypothetical protein
MGGFQFYRTAPVDGVVFLGTAAILIVSLTGVLRRFDGWRWAPGRVLAVVALAVAAIVLVFTPRHGWPDGIVVAATGILVFIVAWPEPSDESVDVAGWSTRLTRSAIAWSCVGLAFCAWELTTYFLGLGAVGRLSYPALSDVINPFIDTPVGRVICIAAWLGGGVALARRGRRAR